MDEDTIARINKVPLDSGTEEPVNPDPSRYAEALEELPWMRKAAESAAAEKQDVEHVDEGGEDFPDVDLPESYPPVRAPLLAFLNFYPVLRLKMPCLLPNNIHILPHPVAWNMR